MMEGDMESIIDGFNCSERMEYILGGFDSSGKMEFNYISSKIKINGEYREDGEAYANTNGNVVIEKEVMGDIEFIPDGMTSSEWIENIHNEFVGEQRVDDQSVADEIIDEPIEVEQSIAEEKKIHKNKKGPVLRGKKIHHNKKGGVVCEGHCGEVFTFKWNLERNLNACLNIIKCKHCGFELRGERNYQKHMKKVHIKYVKKLRCEKCESEFAGEKSLKAHVAKHNPKIANGKFQCEVCKIYMPQKHSIERHKKTIHN